MKRFYQLLQRFLSPGLFLTFLLVLLSVLGLTTVFTRGLEQSALAYAVYPVSFYTLLVLLLECISLFGKIKQMLHKRPIIHRFLTDKAFKADISITVSFGITFVYSILKAAAGIYYRSAWIGTFAAYYVILGITRFLLFRHIHRDRQDLKQQYRKYQFCGWLLSTLTVVLLAISLHTFLGDAAIKYPGFMIYAAAGFSFYNLGISIRNLFRYRKSGNPIHMASKILSFSSSLISIFFLQTAMFAEFGDGGIWQTYMNLATSVCICTAIIAMSAYMIRKAAKELKTMQ